MTINVEGMDNAMALVDRIRPTGNDLPWMGILDVDGRLLASTDSPAGNIGFPLEPVEFPHFMEMLDTTSVRSTDVDRARLLDALKEYTKDYRQKFGVK